MNKKIALVKLIRASLIVSNDDKLALLGKIETMSDEDVEKLGEFLAAEHDFIAQHEAGLRLSVGEIMEEMKRWNPGEDSARPTGADATDRVYVGTGKP